MSRSPGILQRRVCYALDAAEGHELPLRELRRQLGEPDRSNLRRAIRGLLERRLVEESRLGEERCVKLTFVGAIIAHPWPRKPHHTSIDPELRAERWASMEARRAEAAARTTRWFRYRHRFVRQRRLPGPTQKRILSVLWEYADPLDEGLPMTAVKAIVGGDRSNTRRAIRTLLLHGQLDESEGGERIRLSSLAVGSFGSFGVWLISPNEPIDDERAREILRAHGYEPSTRQR